jgi:hypothetical protein
VLRDVAPDAVGCRCGHRRTQPKEPPRGVLAGQFVQSAEYLSDIRCFEELHHLSSTRCALDLEQLAQLNRDARHRRHPALELAEQVERDIELADASKRTTDVTER